MEHHDLNTLLFLARRASPSAHMDDCCFCREQYELAIDFLSVAAGTGEDRAESAERGYPNPGLQYRLAAQTGELMIPQFRLRRTWYLKNNAVILRVIEDTQQQRLTGFFIAEREEDRQLRIRFDGIDGDFMPDSNGVFEIGAASIDIEPMNVTLLA
jgi:hypothetical protein